LDPATKQKILLRSEQDISSVRESVESVVEQVRRTGDRALRELTAEFDHVDLKTKPLRIQPEEFEAAEQMLSMEVREALQFCVDNVRRSHTARLPDGLDFREVRPGIYSGERVTSIESVGLYVPRGRGSFPSMMYMLCVPAVLAGVRKICVTTPPNEKGEVDPACLYAARLSGVDEVYRVGGAQAIAAMAYGTESVPKVAKIVGPGSMYVSAAQRIVAAEVEVGLPAGPSESLVIADEVADPRRVARDLLIEAEHGSDSSAILVTASEDLAGRVADLLPELIAEIPRPRRSFVENVLGGYGGILLFESIESAIDFVNDFAPEHLQVQTHDPFATLTRIKNAGEILLGSNTPFSAANYAIGANAVLPTGGRAKTWSPVSVRDFTKHSSVVFLTDEGYGTIEGPVMTLADYEGFFTHAQALRKRNESP
jgi:histidinol dehydrogenase